MDGLRCPVVHDTTAVYCHWCHRKIGEYVSKIRRKKSSYDTGSRCSKWGYHESCWCEATEVQI